MVEEAYCSFEISKLLKEKGFDKNFVYYGTYYTDDGHFRSDLYDTKMDSCCDAPTHQLAMAWLREKAIHIEIHYNRYGENYKYKIIYKPELLDDINSMGCYFSYEEAVEAALKYVLNYLII